MTKRKKPRPYIRLRCPCGRTTADGPLFRQGNAVYLCAEHATAEAAQ